MKEAKRLFPEEERLHSALKRGNSENIVTELTLLTHDHRNIGQEIATLSPLLRDFQTTRLNNSHDETQQKLSKLKTSMESTKEKAAFLSSLLDHITNEAA